MQELVEARVYRNGDSVKGKKAEEIAEVVFLMIMLLEVIRYIDYGRAKQYAYQTLQFGDFKSMRQASTDMGNLLSVLSNQDKYDDKEIDSNYNIAIPELNLKRYLKDLLYNVKHHDQDRAFLLKLEEYLKVSKYKTIRRIIMDWEKATVAEQKATINVLRREFNAKSLNCDIYQYFRQKF